MEKDDICLIECKYFHEEEENDGIDHRCLHRKSEKGLERDDGEEGDAFHRCDKQK